MPRFLFGASIVGAALCLATCPVSAAEASRPLPEPRAFLEEVRQNLRSDRFLLEQYTFTEQFTERRLDAKGGVKKTRMDLYEVYPSAEPGKMYRRLVAREGQPLSERQLAEQDRKQEQKVEKKERRLAEEDEIGRQKRLAKEEEDRREERDVIEELFRMDDIAVAGREALDGRPTILVTFAPKPGYRPVTDGGKVLQKLEGRAWIDEQDKQLVRIEARLLDSLGVGPGRVARLQKGATAYFQRRKVNDEIWLPAEARFTGAAKLLLLFGARVDIHSRYGDYKKFSVGTEATITTDKSATN
ncbi:MAG TPA: hypothetical protein VGL03_06130 [Thermoanaerobaculia bacterium]